MRTLQRVVAAFSVILLLAMIALSIGPMPAVVTALAIGAILLCATAPPRVYAGIESGYPSFRRYDTKRRCKNRSSSMSYALPYGGNYASGDYARHPAAQNLWAKTTVYADGYRARDRCPHQRIDRTSHHREPESSGDQ